MPQSRLWHSVVNLRAGTPDTDLIDGAQTASRCSRKADVTLRVVLLTAWLVALTAHAVHAQTSDESSEDETAVPPSLEVLGSSVASPSNPANTVIGKTSITSDEGFHLRPALGQAIGFTIFLHALRLTEANTRRELGGPFLNDWMKSISAVGGNWDDGGREFTNYVGHPLGGAVFAHIYRNNDPRRRELRFGEAGYGGMVTRAMLFSAAMSWQFEVGPFSEASIGNVGMRSPDKMGWVDFVITPTLGAAWMVSEDLIDHYVLAHMDNGNVVLRNVVRLFLNPSRSGANLSRLRLPWYRSRDTEQTRRRPKTR